MKNLKLLQDNSLGEKKKSLLQTTLTQEIWRNSNAVVPKGCPSLKLGPPPNCINSNSHNLGLAEGKVC